MLCMHVQYVLLLLVLVILTGFKFYGVARSYSGHPFLCTLALVLQQQMLGFDCLETRLSDSTRVNEGYLTRCTRVNEGYLIALE